ncbi:MAG: flavodoxin-dependent (E)-4-hydroxy-3-methylbut-2-enyl-diphosphate synthase, partial [Candidatus Omnitrophota bacterium]
MIKRRRTRLVRVGKLKIGGKEPVRIQSMAKTDTRDTGRTIAEIKRLEKAGSEIARVAVKDIAAARAIKIIKKKIKTPI